MLLNVNVKNLALIKESDVYFKDGMNILTGETGAGKSIIIGSINMALGGKMNKEMIRSGEESAMVELVFKVDKKNTAEKLKEAGVMMDEDEVIINRKIVNGRSITKVNGETFPVNALKNITSLLIDIHGQHDHQSLLKTEKHLDILDEYAKNELSEQIIQVKDLYAKYSAAEKKLEEFDMDEEARLREFEFYKFEVNEIISANLIEGEDKAIEEKFKKISNMKKILESLSAVHNLMDENAGNNIRNMISEAVNEMSGIIQYDDVLENIYSQLSNIEALCNDVSRDISSYADMAEFDGEKAKELEERLDLINHLKQKYGKTIDDINEYLKEKQEKLEVLENYSVKKEEAEKNLEKCRKELNKGCENLSNLRKTAAKSFSDKVVEVLKDLNFLQVKFDVEFKRLSGYTAKGYDAVEFMISTNPGEPILPLAKIASGGELSRIMLGIKTIMADADDIDTLIFDEIDTGISGRTAQKVAEQMKILSRTHQIICITHLPQIASMADNHLKIEKKSEDDSTSTEIFVLNEEESVEELARMLGGAKITEAVLENAREMKKLALTIK